MGLSRRIRRKYETPNHPWQAERLEEEGKLVKEYGLTNKKQIWKMLSFLRKFRSQARGIVSLRDEKKEQARQILIGKLSRAGLLEKKSTMGDVFNLSIRDILERRLQTIVYKMGFANSIKQARQFVLHRKVLVNGQIISSPSYFIKVGDKVSLREGFNPNIAETITEKPTKENKKVEVATE